MSSPGLLAHFTEEETEDGGSETPSGRPASGRKEESLLDSLPHGARVRTPWRLITVTAPIKIRWAVFQEARGEREKDICVQSQPAVGMSRGQSIHGNPHPPARAAGRQARGPAAPRVSGGTEPPKPSLRPRAASGADTGAELPPGLNLHFGAGPESMEKTRLPYPARQQSPARPTRRGRLYHALSSHP